MQFFFFFDKPPKPRPRLPASYFCAFTFLCPQGTDTEVQIRRLGPVTDRWTQRLEAACLMIASIHVSKLTLSHMFPNMRQISNFMSLQLRQKHKSTLKVIRQHDFKGNKREEIRCPAVGDRKCGMLCLLRSLFLGNIHVMIVIQALI